MMILRKGNAMARNENKVPSLAVALLVSTALTGCGADDNAKPLYGQGSGLPVNCRAYVQVAVDEYRAKTYTAEETISALERNCGINGISWKDGRKK